MELEIYNAFVKAGVPEPEAKAAVESINREIDRRYATHASALATRGDVNEAKADLRADLAEAKTEIIKWCIGSMFTSVALFATITKLWH